MSPTSNNPLTPDPRPLVVLDTMVILGGIFGKPTGLDARTVRAATTGELRLATSDDFFRELARVLGYEAVAKQIDQPVRAFEIGLSLGLMGEFYHPKRLDWPTLTDPKDWWLLDLAFEAGADFIISRDKHLHQAGPKLGFAILHPRELLERLNP